MVGKTKLETDKESFKGNLSAKARAALDMDDLITNLERSAKAAQGGGGEQYDKALADLSALASSSPSNAASSSSAAPSLLQNSILTVVRELKQRSVPDIGAANTINSDLAVELSRFAKADEENRRQDMLISGRAITGHIARMTAELQAKAAGCKDPVLQDKLIRHALSLRTFSTQLKILTSVKAAGSYGNARSDEQQLATLTTMLGRVLTGISDTLSGAVKAKRL